MTRSNPLLAHVVLLYMNFSRLTLCQETEASDEQPGTAETDTQENNELSLKQQAEEQKKEELALNLALQKQDIVQTMQVFLSILGVICLVGCCCLCLAPNSTRLNFKLLYFDIKMTDEQEEIV